MTVKERVEDWKKTIVNENKEIDLALFKAIVKSAKEIECRTFDFRISKKSLLNHVKYARIIAFNGFNSLIHGDQACYRLERKIGRDGGNESLTLYIRL